MRLRTIAICLVSACAFLALFTQVKAQDAAKPGKKKATSQAKIAKKQEEESSSGIFVDRPKIYDDLTLTNLLQSANQGLANLNPFNSTTVSNALTGIQGATISQTTASVQVTSPNTTGSTAPGSNSPSLTAPDTSKAAISAADLVNQQTQLASLIASFQLLLQGALSDQLENGTSSPKQRVTMGFPITIRVPPGFQYRDAVAEVRISVCAQPGTAAEKPSLVTLLPQSKTYNVASLVTKSSQIGSGAVSKIFPVAGSFLHASQNYYLVQDQDTIAFQQSPYGECSALEYDEERGFHQTTYPPLVFGWQFKPVLGQAVVQDGIRQTFVQLAFSPSLANPGGGFESSLSCEEKTIKISTGWRTFDRRTGRVGKPIGEFKENVAAYAPVYNAPPVPLDVAVDDNGDSTLTVLAKGAYKASTYVRLGSLVLTPGAPPIPSPQPASAVPSPANANTNPPAPAVAPQTPPAAPAANAPAAATPNTANAAQPAATPAPSNAPGQTPAPTTAAPALTPSMAAVTENYIKFVAPAYLIALNGAKLVNLDGTEHEVERGYRIAPQVTCRLRLAQYLSKKPAKAATAEPAPEAPSANPPACSAKDRIVLTPFSDSLTQVTLRCLPLLVDDYSRNPVIPVVVIDSTVFGLRDRPFNQPPKYMSSPDDKFWEVSLFVPNALLAKPGRRIIWKYLFERQDPEFYDIPETAPVTTQPVTVKPVTPIPAPPSEVSRCALSSQTASLVATDTPIDGKGKYYLYAIAGQNLDRLRMVAPRPTQEGVGDINGPRTLYQFYLESSLAKTTVNVFLQCGTDAPVSVSLPTPPAAGTGAGATTTTTASATAPAPETAVVKAGQTFIPITGKNLNNVVQVFWSGQKLDFTLHAAPAPPTAGDASITIDSEASASNKKLIAEITANPPPGDDTYPPQPVNQTLLLLGIDNIYHPVTLTVQPPPPPPPPEPDQNTSVSVGQSYIIINGKNLNGVRQILWKSQDLKFDRPTAASPSIRIDKTKSASNADLIAKITASPGPQPLVLVGIDKVNYTVTVTVLPPKPPVKK